MDFGINIPNRSPAAGHELITLARKADELGFHSIWVSDHVTIPAQISSQYPYGTFGGDDPGTCFEPLTTLTFLAGCTERVRLGTSVLVLPYRPPVLAAKMIATLDALSGGRMILGVGVGWMEEEFRALQTFPFAERGDVTDEQLRVFKTLWAEPLPAFAGKYYQFPAQRFGPKPTQQPHPPIWVGGHGKRAMRRAATFGDGWQAVRVSPDELSPLLAQLREILRTAGRDPAHFTLSLRCYLHVQDTARPGCSAWELVAPPAAIAQTLHRFAELGVHHVCFDLSNELPLAERLRSIERFATEVMPEFRS